MTYWRNTHVPEFGSWEYCNNEDDLPPFTQCFETARQPSGLSFPIYTSHSKDRDLYQNAVIVVPRHSHRGKGRYGYQKEKEYTRNKDRRRWVECDAVKFAPPPPPPSVPRRVRPMAVDEDLYKISPELLYAKPKKKRMGFLSSCLFPSCHV
ncbi:uncharacterized protein LOC124914210 [Impatiens glandulifera]|uniref:uncharacterized protein LOC124914210 n=1 Tax=Impatiens glandulifera TaxID=253017 RepID=UPI001FB0FBAE|nr:uncharacterized protein LOC124914210 [Impatiens glandulifera]XP_047310667.1 uncharacterized protein LOC124914210 [Impatiens glandulifera]